MPASVCIVTGASRGIGLATALRFAALRHNIVAAARNLEELGRARQRIESGGVACEALDVDLMQPEGANELVDAAMRRFGRVDILVNNAGYATGAPFDEISANMFQHMMSLNCDALFRLTQAVWPIMKSQGGGIIVNVSSLAAIDPFPGFSVYSASKAWVNALTAALATEGRPLGIRIYAVAPGAVETSLLRQVAPNLPTDRCLSPDDVAGVIESVCDPRMTYATGEVVYMRRS